jgi:serine protease AprX
MKRMSGRNLIRGLTAFAVLAALVWTGLGEADAGSQERVRLGVAVYTKQHPGEDVAVIVRVREGAARAGGQLADSVETSAHLPLIDGFAATLPPAEIDRLARDPAVLVVSLDAEMMASGNDDDQDGTSDLGVAYPFAVNAVAAWDEGISGEGITVAVIDSGVRDGNDLSDSLVGGFNFSSLEHSAVDLSGHGTYVAGVIAGEADAYTGIAPGAQILSLKVADREGRALASDVVAALQWAVDHRDEYDIRVVNISLVSSIADSYLQDPLDAAVEQAWFHGIVVVVAVGNYGDEEFAVDHAPANDPYVITVGAFDDAGTADTADDTAVDWSSRGLTVDGYAKPEVLAPGQGVLSALASRGSYLARAMPEAVVDGRYLRLSGTSPSAAVVSGVVALMLEDDPDLTPDQVKFRLMQTGQPLDGSQAPRVDAFAAIQAKTNGQANHGATPNDLIDPETGEILYDSVLWRSVLWRSVLWRSVLWRSVLVSD